MSDEEDYMSDTFLLQLPDTRPGLVPKHVARKNELQKKEQLANAKNKQKPRAVIEKEKREEGLGASLSSDNKGFSLLQKMGYRPGMAIGKTGVGRTEPIPVEVKTGRGGLGRETEEKRKKDARNQMYKNWTAKRQKIETEHKQTFMKRMNEKVKNRNVEKDLYKSQKVCEQLDSQVGIKLPHEPFFWPKALLPKPTDADDEYATVQDERLEGLLAGYSSFVQDELSEDERLEGPSAGYSSFVQDELSEDEPDDEDNAGGDDEQRPSQNFSMEEQLDVLTIYLRTKHKYCIWCGTKYNDREDLMQHCPGNSAELHEDL